MDALLAALRACAEPTRLRLLALAARGAFCVVELTEILGQSQPRLSRHLKLLCDAGVLERVREGANVWFGLPPDAGLVHELLAPHPGGRPGARRRPPRGGARAGRAGAHRLRQLPPPGRRLGRDARARPARRRGRGGAALAAAARARSGRVLDIGTGTGRLLELLAPRVQSGLGVDASRAMLALARARLAKPGLGHLAVRQADMYRLPLAQRFDLVVMQMVLHYAEDPAAALAEAARVLAPGGRLIVVDLAAHDRAALAERLAHRWPGFADADDGAHCSQAPGLLPGGQPVRRRAARSPALDRDRAGARAAAPATALEFAQ